MNVVRVALGNLPFPETPDESVARVEQAIKQAGERGAQVICFPECYVPGYRLIGRHVPTPDQRFLERAWSAVAAAAKTSRLSVVLGTERIAEGRLFITALVIDQAGSRLGFQDKVQLDPSEDSTFIAGSGRKIFRTGELTFGVVICHEGFRYPETVRAAVRQGAQVVFHPHVAMAESGSYRPSTFGERANSFHEKAVLCRAAENTCYFATVNCASPGSPTTSAMAGPDGTMLCYQPYGEEGLLVADIDLDLATRLLAVRCKSS